MPVARLLSALPDGDPLPFEAREAALCHAGQSWNWNGVRFELLHPTRESHAQKAIRDNNRGCVLRVATRGAAMLIPADIEARAERELLARASHQLRAQVLIAPHHGSKTSSTPEFVQAVDPRVVVYTVGYRNRHGHPHVDVQERYLRHGAHVYRSDRDGALTLRLSGTDTVRVTPHRATYRRYWQTVMENDAVPHPDDI
jgi:competence protein ComEC